MVPSKSRRNKTTLLSLPDDILAKIFMLICGNIGYTLTGAMYGLNLAHANTRLQRVFSSLLTRITPVIKNCKATGFAEQDVEALVRIAGENLRELHIPDCRHAYIHELPQLCPNLEAISYREKLNTEFSFACTIVQQNDTDDNEGEGDDDNHGEEHEDADADADGGDNNAGDNAYYLDLDCSDDGWTPHPDRAFVGLLPLRSLAVFNSSGLHTLPCRSLQELRFYNVQEVKLPLVTRHFSEQLRHLVLTIPSLEPESECFTSFMNCLLQLVPQLASLTLHIALGPGSLWMAERTDIFEAKNFLEEAKPLIAHARQNESQSKCMTVNLQGPNTWEVLKFVNPDASITLSGDKVSVRDNGKGLEIIELPLDNIFLNQNVTHMETVHIFWSPATDDDLSLEWSLRLGHGLRVIRTDRPWVLNALKLSTERLELYCDALPDVTDWTFLSGARELRLIGTPWILGRHAAQVQVGPFIEAMVGMVEEFRGEFIHVRQYPFVYFEECLSPEAAAQSAKSLIEAIDRFVKRGGDAGTLEAYVHGLLSAIEGRKKSVDEINARTWKAGT